MEPHSKAAPGAGAHVREPEHGGINLMKLFGVQVRLDWSLLIIFALVVFNFGAGVLPKWHPDWGPLGTWSLAVTAAVVFFASLLAHEMSHALVARRVGIQVKRITLFLFGGMAHMESQPPTPRSEFLMAVVGPLMSIALGVLGTLWGVALAGVGLNDLTDSASLLAVLRASGPAATLLLWLGPINLALGVFNLVPGFPLDGGRVLRAILWGVTGDLTRATRWATGAGQAVAWGLMGLGVMNFFGGSLGQGLWLVLIGWFLNNAARSSYQQLLIKQSLEEVRVTSVMNTRLDRVLPGLSIEELVREHLMPSDQRAFPVEEAGTLVGLVTFDDLRRVPQADWIRTPVSAVMTPARMLTTLPPDALADQALDALAKREVEQIPVLEGEHLLGLVRRQDLVRWLSLHQGPPGHLPI